MAQNRKQFLQKSLAGLAGLGSLGMSQVTDETRKTSHEPTKVAQKPVVLSTWIHGIVANEEAWKILSEGGSALDAVEVGVKTAESDPQNQSVGLGGFPDREGRVTLDACIMNHEQQCGSVAFLEHIVHPISVARKVMEETPHVMLVGAGALQFAEAQGFERQNLLTEASEKAWKKWLEDSKYAPVINVENHDTIGMLCLDKNNNISGACTTSGLAYKMKGRVGDSPIIGSGLFIDNNIGGAVATGLGEEVLKTVGSFLVVELMRQGMSPQEACESAVKRIVSSNSQKNKFQVAYIAMNKEGDVGSYSVEPGFTYMDYFNGENKEKITESAF